MNKTARHVFRLCVTARNLRRPPRTMTWTCYSQSALLRYSSHSKDYTNSMIPATQSAKGDVILQVLSRARSTEDIFEIVREYHPLLKSQHCLEALKVLDKSHRLKNLTEVSLVKKWEFMQLCEVLVSDINSLDANDAVYILKAFPYLGVPSTSVVSQSLLQLTRKSLSSLTFNRLVDLEYQLKAFQSTPLADAMKIAVPIMCEMHLNNNMIDTSNVNHLMNALSFLRNKPGNDKSVEMVINALTYKGHDLSANQAKRIFKYLCDIKELPSGYKELLLITQQVLTRAMPGLSFFWIQTLLGKVVKKVIYHGNNAFYNEEFVDACAKAVISKDYGFDEGVTVLKHLYYLSHTQIRLIDYLAAKCFENSLLLSKSSITSTMILVIGLATADYKPIFWENMQETILGNMEKVEYRYKPILLDFAISLAVLDCYNVALMRSIFTESFLNILLKTETTQTYWNLLLLYQSVKTLRLNYSGPLPPQHLIEAAIKSNGPSVTRSSLLPILENAMGGPQYVSSNLKSKLGHHIDHVVVMRKGGYPIALNSLPEVGRDEPIVYIEDLVLPAESQVISIINLPASAYAVNSRRLKGAWTLLLKTLETQTGHTVIPISTVMWNELSDHEKTPYLMQAIRLKCENLSASANV